MIPLAAGAERCKQVQVHGATIQQPREGVAGRDVTAVGAVSEARKRISLDKSGASGILQEHNDV